MANNQETNRNTVDEIVDERTLFEMYYQPFAGAIEGGVMSVMSVPRMPTTPAHRPVSKA